MTLPNRDSLSTFGGTLGAGYADFASSLDPTTDMPASAGNQLLSDVAMMTRTAVRAWVRFAPAGVGTVILVAHYALWGNASGVAPVLAYGGSTGIYTITWPATVQDDITVTSAAGYVGPQALNLLATHGQCESPSALWNVQGSVSGNVGTYALYNSSGALAGPSGVAFTAFVY